jgi:hypothetical protein
MLFLKQLGNKLEEDGDEFWDMFQEIRSVNKTKLITFNLSEDSSFNDFSDALFSLSYSDFSEEARLYLVLFFIIDRFLHDTRPDRKRLFFFAGHALDSDKANYSHRELANFVLQMAQKL